MRANWLDRLLRTVFSHYANKNSLTRDELANERSFLAYIRCSTTMLVSSFSITQALLQMIILSVQQIATVSDAVSADGGDAGGSDSGDTDADARLSALVASYTSHVHDYRHLIRPITLFICAVALFCSCLGFKKAWLNFYNLAERAKFQPGLIGMGLIFLSVFAVDIALLRQCIIFGISEFSH